MGNLPNCPGHALATVVCEVLVVELGKSSRGIIAPERERSDARVMLSDWLRPTSIAKQFGGVLLLLGMMALLLGSIALYGFSRMEERAAEISQLSDIGYESVKLRRKLSIILTGLENYREPESLGSLGSKELNAVQQARQKAVALLNQSQKEDDAQFSQILVVLEEELARLETSLLALGNSSRSLAPDQDYLEASYAAISRTSVQITELQGVLKIRVRAVSQSNLQDAKMLSMACFAAISIMMVLLIVGKTLLTRRVIVPIAAISDASERIARGQSELEIPGRTREDEVGVLARSLEVFRGVQVQAAENAMRELEQQRELDRHKEEQRAEQTALLHSFAEKFEETISGVAVQVSAASKTVSDGARSLASNVETSFQRVEDSRRILSDASGYMTGAAAASDQFALSINEVSEQAGVSSERAIKAAAAAQSADTTIKEMTESADQISQIVEVIAGIARRTNLLALNAAIEAARHADTGRGFAVVANEVKELAAQTHRETARVELLIMAMQNATGQSASALATIAQEVIELQSSAGAIAGAVEQQANAGRELARAVDLAASNTGQVSDNIEDVNNLMSGSRDTADRLQESSEQLRSQLTLLRKHADEFLDSVKSA